MNRMHAEDVIENQDVDALKKAQLVDLESLGCPRVGSMSVSRTAEIRSSRFGVGFETLDREMFRPETVYPLMAELGAKWARVQTGWSRCETEVGEYQFEWLDEVVDRLLDAGVQPFFSVTFGNRLYMPDAPQVSAVGYSPTGYGADVQAAWVRYVGALVEHFCDRVAYWEVWNEPNIPQFWQPGRCSGASYAELVKLTAGVIRSVMPDAHVIGGALSKMDAPYLEAALQAGLADEIDSFSFHPYQSVPEHNLQMMHDLIRRLLDRYSGGRRIGIWQGENGCPSQISGHNDDWLGLYDVDQVVQAKWVARRLLVDLKVGFERILYFHATDLMERPYVQSGGEARKPVMMGLIHGIRYEPKFSFEVFQRVASLFDENCRREDLMVRFLEPDPRHPQMSGLMASPIQVTFVRDRVPLLVYWLTEDPQQKREAGEIDVVYWWDSDWKLQAPVLVDLLTGAIHDVAHRGRDFVCDGAVQGRLFRLPLTDYPLILSDASLFLEGGT